MFWEYLSQGGHEHWGELSKGGVVQGRIKVISTASQLSSTSKYNMVGVSHFFSRASEM